MNTPKNRSPVCGSSISTPKYTLRDNSSSGIVIQYRRPDAYPTLAGPLFKRLPRPAVSPARFAFKSFAAVKVMSCDECAATRFSRDAAEPKTEWSWAQASTKIVGRREKRIVVQVFLW